VVSLAWESLPPLGSRPPLGRWSSSWQTHSSLHGSAAASTSGPSALEPSYPPLGVQRQPLARSAEPMSRVPAVTASIFGEAHATPATESAVGPESIAASPESPSLTSGQPTETPNQLEDPSPPTIEVPVTVQRQGESNATVPTDSPPAEAATDPASTATESATAPEISDEDAPAWTSLPKHPFENLRRQPLGHDQPLGPAPESSITETTADQLEVPSPRRTETPTPVQRQADADAPVPAATDPIETIEPIETAADPAPTATEAVPDSGILGEGFPVWSTLPEPPFVSLRRYPLGHDQPLGPAPESSITETVPAITDQPQTRDSQPQVLPDSPSPLQPSTAAPEPTEVAPASDTIQPSPQETLRQPDGAPSAPPAAELASPPFPESPSLTPDQPPETTVEPPQAPSPLRTETPTPVQRQADADAPVPAATDPIKTAADPAPTATEVAPDSGILGEEFPAWSTLPEPPFASLRRQPLGHDQPLGAAPESSITETAPAIADQPETRDARLQELPDSLPPLQPSTAAPEPTEVAPASDTIQATPTGQASPSDPPQPSLTSSQEVSEDDAVAQALPETAPELIPEPATEPTEAAADILPLPSESTPLQAKELPMALETPSQEPQAPAVSSELQTDSDPDVATPSSPAADLQVPDISAVPEQFQAVIQRQPLGQRLRQPLRQAEAEPETIAAAKPGYAPWRDQFQLDLPDLPQRGDPPTLPGVSEPLDQEGIESLLAIPTPSDYDQIPAVQARTDIEEMVVSEVEPVSTTLATPGQRAAVSQEQLERLARFCYGQVRSHLAQQQEWHRSHSYSGVPWFDVMPRSSQVWSQHQARVGKHAAVDLDLPHHLPDAHIQELVSAVQTLVQSRLQTDRERFWMTCARRD